MSQPVIIKNKPLYLWLHARLDPSAGIYFALNISIVFLIIIIMNVDHAFASLSGPDSKVKDM